MKVTNQTGYETRYLRKLCLACERHAGSNPKYRRVYFYKTKGKMRGRAGINANWIEIWLPQTSLQWEDGIGSKLVHKAAEPDTKELCRIYLHELDHNLGIRDHKDMEHWWNIKVNFWPDETIPRKPIKEVTPKPKQDVILQRYEKAKKKELEYLKKLKRTLQLTKKWKAKVRYYERTYPDRIAASTKH